MPKKYTAADFGIPPAKKYTAADFGVAPAKKYTAADFGVAPAKKYTAADFGVAPPTPTPEPSLLSKAYELSKIPSQKSREGLEMMLNAIPDPQTKSQTLNFIMGIPKVGAEIFAELSASSLDPLSVGLMGAGAGVGQLAKVPAIKAGAIATAKYLTESIPSWIRRPFMVRPFQPQEYIDAAYNRINKMKLAVDIANKTGTKLSKDLTIEAQKTAREMLTNPNHLMWQGFDWGVEKLPQIGLKGKRVTKQFYSHVKEARSLVDTLSDTVISEGRKSGMISDELADIIISNKGKYLPRLYRLFEDPKILDNIRLNKTTLAGELGTTINRAKKLQELGLTDSQISAFERLTPGAQDAFVKKITGRLPDWAPKVSPVRIKIPFLNKKLDLEADYRKALGEVETAAFPTAKAIVTMNNAIETSRLFNYVADNPDWISSIARSGFVKMPETKSLGKLAGKFIQSEIAKDLNEIIRIPTSAERTWNSVNSLWKSAKIVYNPATQFRNLYGNAILLDLSGVDFLQQPALLKKAATTLMMKDKSRWFREAKTEGLLGNEFIGTEAKQLWGKFGNVGSEKSVFEHFTDVVKYVPEKMADIYQYNEQWFKMSKFIHSREAGLSVKESVLEAEKWLFNYNKISDATRLLRNMPLGAPFITFTAKALPRVLEAGLKNPMRVYKYKLMMDAMNATAREKLNLSDDDISAITRNQRGSFAILPWRDMNNLPMTLDLSYILPWGDIAEQGQVFGLPGAIAPMSGPLRPAVELAFNKSLYTQKEIYSKHDLPIEKMRKGIDHAYKSLLPSLAPPIPGITPGGYSAHKLASAITAAGILKEKPAALIRAKKADYFGRVRSIPVVLLDVILGIKAMPADPQLIENLEKSALKKDKNEIVGDAKSLLRDGGISETQEQQIIEMMHKKIDLLLENSRD